MLQRHDFANPFEGALLDLPRLLDGETEPASSVGEAARVPVDEPHPKLHHPPLDLWQTSQHALEGARQLSDSVLPFATLPAAPRRSTGLTGCIAAPGTVRRPTSPAPRGTGGVRGLLW